MNDLDLRQRLEQSVPLGHERPDWSRVVSGARAAQRRSRLLRLAIVAAALAAFMVTPAFGIGSRLLDLVDREGERLELPKSADAAQARVILEPGSGRFVVRAAPMRDRDGICYVFRESRGCSLRSRRGSLVLFSSPPRGYTFDRRVVAVDARLKSGRRIPLVFRRLGAPIDVAFFFGQATTGQHATAVLMRDQAGMVIHRLPSLRRPGG